MLQHLLRRLVFDVPILNEFAKMPLKVRAVLSGFSPTVWLYLWTSGLGRISHAHHS